MLALKIHRSFNAQSLTRDLKLLGQLYNSLVIYNMLEKSCVELQEFILDAGCTLLFWEY